MGVEKGVFKLTTPYTDLHGWMRWDFERVEHRDLWLGGARRILVGGGAASWLGYARNAARFDHD